MPQVDDVPYEHQPALLDLLHVLMMRAELDYPALIGAERALHERYLRVLWGTVGYVTAKLNKKAAPTEVRVFCSNAMAVAFFRLPALRTALLQVILPDGENRFKHIREWNLPWSLQTRALAGAGCIPSSDSASSAVGAAAVRSPARPGPNGTLCSVLFTSTTKAPPGPLSLHTARGHVAADGGSHRYEWAALWARVEGAMEPGRKAALAAAAQRALGGRYWRERLSKRGHCFFLLLEHWSAHVRVACGVQPDELIDWKGVPGYAQLIKAFLLETKARPVHLWPESMRSCMRALAVANRDLLKVFARILLGKVSPPMLRPSLASLKQLSAVLDAVADDAAASLGSSIGAGFGMGIAGREYPSELIAREMRGLVSSDHFKVRALPLP